MDDRIKWWFDKAKWPIDNPGRYRFLARAVHDVGQGLFPDEWTRHEPLTPEPYGIPNFSTPDGKSYRLPQALADAKQKLIVNDLLIRHHPEFGRKPAERGPFGPKPQDFTAEEWAAGIEVSSRIDSERYQLRRRLDVVQETISTACLSGELVSVLRPLEGGSMTAPLDPQAYWNGERMKPRFFWCQMHPANPFGVGLSGDGYQFIYLTQDSLDRFLQTLSPAASHTPEPTQKKAAPTQEIVADFFRNVVLRLWKGDGKSNEYRVTKDEFHELCKKKWPDVSTYITRPVFEENRPIDWGPGRFPRTQSFESLATAILGTEDLSA
ncbi:hypothetical protein [Aminobacter aminovorans]|uniref:hypothetical protein n=1 Tax=Aminobacter aminovorans TaxID=83263 RepID=UPI00285D2BA4|nr:hypothetical protein [Aminobacter aminovorans]MDR7221700.1 hypothetical protein [Aminobacter aminovorans]